MGDYITCVSTLNITAYFLIVYYWIQYYLIPGGFNRTFATGAASQQRMLSRLLLRTLGPVPFGTCICSNVEAIIYWTCHVYEPFEFRHPSVLLFCPSVYLLLESECSFTKYRCLWNTNAPFPNLSRIGLTFDPDLWPDLNINRGHLIIIDYLPTKFEACGAKRSWVIGCTRWSRLAWPLTFDLLTWISIGIIYSSKTIYLPCLKLVGQSILELSVAHG